MERKYATHRPAHTPTNLPFTSMATNNIFNKSLSSTKFMCPISMLRFGTRFRLPLLLFSAPLLDINAPTPPAAVYYEQRCTFSLCSSLRHTNTHPHSHSGAMLLFSRLLLCTLAFFSEVYHSSHFIFETFSTPLSSTVTRPVRSIFRRNNSKLHWKCTN